MEWLSVVSQWLHLTAAVTGIGGLIYARLVVAPALMEAPLETRAKLLECIVARARPISLAVIGVLLVTGLYNLFAHLSTQSSTYQMILGIKILLALHVFTVVFLLSIPPGVNPARDARRPRLMMGAVVSGIIILLLSALLRRGGL